MFRSGCADHGPLGSSEVAQPRHGVTTPVSGRLEEYSCRDLRYPQSICSNGFVGGSATWRTPYYPSHPVWDEHSPSRSRARGRASGAPAEIVVISGLVQPVPTADRTHDIPDRTPAATSCEVNSASFDSNISC